MTKAECKYCDYKVEKPRWEHIISAIKSQGGHAGGNICPKCKKNGLEFDWGERYEYRRIFKN